MHSYWGPSFPRDAGTPAAKVGGNGSATVLPMSEEQIAAAAEREQNPRPFGFQREEEHE